MSSILEEFPYFDTGSNEQKLSVILSYSSVEILRVSAKTCYEILMRRRLLLYNWHLCKCLYIHVYISNSKTVSHDSLRMVLTHFN